VAQINLEWKEKNKEKIGRKKKTQKQKKATVEKPNK
jgi:hypothetical protein